MTDPSTRAPDAHGQPRWIIVAWLDTEQEPTNSVDAIRVDLGERVQWRAVTVAKAVVWLREGVSVDVASAEKWAATQNEGRVYCYPLTETDPLGRARAERLRGAQ